MHFLIPTLAVHCAQIGQGAATEMADHLSGGETATRNASCAEGGSNHYPSRIVLPPDANALASAFASAFAP